MSGDGRRRTRLSAARESLFERIEPHGRTKPIQIEEADGRVAAAPVAAPAAVPETALAAVDGYAVRAADTFGAADRSPAVLRIDASVGRETATRVAAGESLPAAADAVVPDESVDRLGNELEVFDAVPENGNVTPAGSVVAADEQLLAAGERVRPATLGLLETAGVERVPVADRPVVVVLAVENAPGAVVAATCARRWGARAVVRRIERGRRALRDAIDAATATSDTATGEADAATATSDTATGEADAATDRDDLTISETGETGLETADVIHVVGHTDAEREIGRRLVCRLAVEPGGETTLAVTDGTPVVTSPGGPVATLVGAVGLVRPAIRVLDGRATTAPPGRRARLTRKLRSAPGVRTFVPVTVTAPAENRETSTDEESEYDTDGESDGETRVDGESDGETRVDGESDGETRVDEKNDSETPTEDRQSANATSAGETAVASPLEATGAATPSHASRADGWVAVPESREGIDAGTVVMVRNWEVDA